MSDATGAPAGGPPAHVPSGDRGHPGQPAPAAAPRGTPGVPRNAAQGYAAAVFAAATAEGAIDRVEDEFFTFARTLESHPELRERLIDPATDVATKLEIVGGLLERRAHPQTMSAVMYVVQSGRTRELSDIAQQLTQLAAQSRQAAVAEVHTAVPLTEQQRDRLASAIGQATGKTVALKVIVDPGIVGGVVVKVGDTVIDGSVARRLSELRGRLVGA